MLTQEFRPQTFKDVSGQELVISTLKAIVKSPKESPKTLILQGEYGTGKTTCARIFAKALNCRRSKDGDACGECEICKATIDNFIYYEEFDSAMMGNVESIKQLRDNIHFDESLGYKVIVLDEAQLMTPQAQSALLKVLEESLSGVFFLLCTTNVDKILSTIQSRSLRLKFELVNKSLIEQNILNVSNVKNIEINPNTISKIAAKSRGHLRDAHMLLDQYILLGETEFNNLIKSPEDLFYKLIISALREDFNLVNKIIDELLKFPLYQLKDTYEQSILNIITSALKVKVTDNKFILVILESYKTKIFSLIDVLNNTSIYSMFTSDTLFQSAMYLIVKNIIQTKMR